MEYCIATDIMGINGLQLQFQSDVARISAWNEKATMKMQQRKKNEPTGVRGDVRRFCRKG